MTHKTHRAFGCYGIATIDDKLVVIKKNGGPYRHRFDLPGVALMALNRLNMTSCGNSPKKPD